MSLTAYLSGAKPLPLSGRRERELLAWLADHPDSDATEAAAALGRPIRATHRRLLRLEREGRVQAYTAQDEFFNYIVYRALESPHAHR